jgi:hypothetical protein
LSDKLPSYTVDDFEFLLPELENEVPQSPRTRDALPRHEDREKVLDRASKYLAAVPPAIEGSGGDHHTYVTCCKLVRDFGLTDAEALELLRDWNSRCEPPWNEQELQEKIRNAQRYGENPIGWKLDDPLKGNGNGKTEERHIVDEEREAIRAEGAPIGSVANNEPSSRPEAFQAPAHWKWLDVSELPDWDCLPLRWNIQDLIAQGNFVIVAAETQTGKTLLGLFLSQSMLHPGQLFGRLEVTPVDKILYLGLEDPDRRFKDRLHDIEPLFPKIEGGRFIVHIAPGFNLNDPKMVDYLESLVTTHAFKAVFLDTYQKATPGLSSFGDEEQSAILHRLCNLTRKYDVTLIVMDHVRKRDGQQKKRNVLTIDDIKGTGGKAQNADCVILMERTPDRKQVRFQSFSKDSDQPVRIVLDVSPKGSSEPKFKYAGDLDQLATDAKTRANANAGKVLNVFVSEPDTQLSTSTVAERTGFSDATARRHLASLVKTGKLDCFGGGKNKRYWLIPNDSAQKAN